jgi:hypothetical protein
MTMKSMHIFRLSCLRKMLHFSSPNSTSCLLQDDVSLCCEASPGLFALGAVESKFFKCVGLSDRWELSFFHVGYGEPKHVLHAMS